MAKTRRTSQQKAAAAADEDNASLLRVFTEGVATHPRYLGNVNVIKQMLWEAVGDILTAKERGQDWKMRMASRARRQSELLLGEDADYPGTWFNTTGAIAKHLREHCGIPDKDDHDAVRNALFYAYAAVVKGIHEDEDGSTVKTEAALDSWANAFLGVPPNAVPANIRADEEQE